MHEGPSASISSSTFLMSDFLMIPTLAGVTWSPTVVLLTHLSSLIFVCPGSLLLSSLGCTCGEQGLLSVEEHSLRAHGLTQQLQCVSSVAVAQERGPWA